MAVQSYILELRGLTLLQGGRGAEADAAFAQREAAMPAMGKVLIGRFSMGLKAKPVDLDRMVALVARIARDHTESARELPWKRIRYLTSLLWEAHREADVDRVYLALGRIGYGGADVSLRDDFAVGAADVLLKQGATDEAAALATRVVSLDRLERMLADRTYAPLWPALERSVGAGYKDARGRAADAARAFLAAQPNSPAAVQYAIETAALLDQTSEADRIGQAYSDRPGRFEVMGEDEGWVVNAHAEALAAAGRLEAADRVYARLATLDPARRSWLINTALNRVGMLVFDKRYQAAACLIPSLQPQLARSGTPYAYQLARFYTVCTEAGFGHTVRAVEALPDLLKHAPDGRMSTVHGLMCLDRQDDAAGQLVLALQEERSRREAIALFQPPGFTGSELIARSRDMQQLLARPDVRAAFDRVGRVLPKSLSAS